LKRGLRLAAALLLVAASAAVLADEPVQLRLRMRGGASVPAETTLRLRAVADASSERTVVLHAGKGDLSLPAGSEWEVASASQQYWMLPRRIAASASPVELELWPVRSVTGTVSVAEGPRPAEVTLAVESPPDARGTADIPRGTKFHCPVAADGGWMCLVPGARLDLALHAPGMTPHYRWDVDVAQKQTTDLGAFRLRKGASFVAYLDRNLASQLKKPARARLLRPVAPVASEAAAQLAAPVAEGEFDRRGWVQLAPLPAGSYILEVRAEGYAPARIAPVEIYEGKESAYRKLIELLPPSTVTVAVTPPTDGDARWQVRLARQGDVAAQENAGGVAYADPQGVASFEELAPGLYDVAVLDAAGNALWNREIQLGDGDLRVPVELQLGTIAGKVLLGDQPIAATLWFGGSDGAVRVRMQSSAGGDFAGRLPRLGHWTVRVTNADVQTLADVDVEADEEVVIRLPTTSVSGWVTGADGERLPRALVSVMTGGRALVTKADEKGEFRLQGLPAGAVQLLAEDRVTGGSSASVALQLSEGETREGVELRIEPNRTLSGTIVSGGQPVAGARVSAAAQGIAGSASEAVSGLTGRFSVRLPAAATRAHLTVAAPNRTLQTFETPVSAEPLLLEIAADGGTLEVQGRIDPRLIIRRNGVRVPLPSILGWLAAHGRPMPEGEVLSVPDLAPGQYEVCGTKCAAGTLAPGATLRLALE
jgi:hypothetical protein